ncbi:LOW QUALITY PROTEIN: hypothetical protein ACHAXR_003038, partial [Thalassiosira sp. AJA248-18]
CRYSTWDLGFNNISDEGSGCTPLATRAASRNPALSTLYLSGNAVREKGALALAEVIALGHGGHGGHGGGSAWGSGGASGGGGGGTGLTSLHFTANRIGPRGVKGLMRSIVEFDVTMQMALQDRENRLALEEEQNKRKKMKEDAVEGGRGGNDNDGDVDLESTLREIKLDNKQIRDRGAQLAAVVLTSVDLEVLDMGFNRLTIVGIKRLMKSLAENRSLLTLTFWIRTRAVSHALAYNKTIRKLYVDHCSLSYAAQRHIAAGIVLNSNLALRVACSAGISSGSHIGHLGAMETWPMSSLSRCRY